MTFEKARQEFQIRYYRWALSEFESEINNSFPNLRTFKNGPIWDVYRFMLIQKMTQSQQLTAARGLVKTAHYEAVKLLGESISEAENLWGTKCSLCVGLGHLPLKIDPSTPKVRYASKSKLRKAIQIAFTKAYGSRCVQIRAIEGSEELWYEMKFAGWIVTTGFRFGRHRKDNKNGINYTHSIGSEAKISIPEFPPEVWPPAMRLGYGISSACWLGINSDTTWTSLEAGDVDQACNDIIKYCGHFFEALPQLLKGLEFDKITTE